MPPSKYQTHLFFFAKISDCYVLTITALFFLLSLPVGKSELSLLSDNVQYRTHPAGLEPPQMTHPKPKRSPFPETPRASPWCVLKSFCNESESDSRICQRVPGHLWLKGIDNIQTTLPILIASLCVFVVLFDTMKLLRT